MAYTTIDDPELYFQAKTYTGTGSSLALTFDGEDMQPDMVWLKGRSHAGNHFLYDSVRGANRSLVPNDADAEDTSGESTSYLTSFDSDGITLGGSYNNTNASSRTYCAWNWKGWQQLRLVQQVVLERVNHILIPLIQLVVLV